MWFFSSWLTPSVLAPGPSNSPVMLTSKLEILVDFDQNPDEQMVNRTLNVLKSQDGVKEAVFKEGAILVETTLPSFTVVDIVSRCSGRRAVLQGHGELQSAVAMVSSQSCCSKKVMGVVRFAQSSEDALVAEGTIDGLRGTHGLHVHESGDLSEGCLSIGPHYNPDGGPHGGPADPPARRHAGDLGNIVADAEGRAVFRIVDTVLKVSDIIGRSVGISERADDLGCGVSVASSIDGDSGQTIACGIIARAAGVLTNPKRICACDGVAVWDERDRPLAGAGRREHSGCCGTEKDDGAEREDFVANVQYPETKNFDE